MKQTLQFIAQICLGLILLLSAGKLNAQPEGYSKTYNYRGDTANRFDFTGTNFVVNPATGSIIFPYYSGDQQFRFLNQWLSLDPNGNIIREVTEEIPDATFYLNTNVAYAFNSSSEFYAGGGYNLAGDTFSTLFLQKRDTLLNTIWRKEYQLPYLGQIQTIIPLDEQSIILQAVIYRDSSAQYPAYNPRVELIKTDTAGNIIWHRSVDDNDWSSVLSVIKAHDGNLILCGRTWGYGVTDGAAFVMKVDTAGNKIWHRVYDMPGYDGLEKMVATADGNYVCAGWANIPPELSNMTNGAGRVLKINEQGDIIWDKLINDCPSDEWFRTIIMMKNGDVVAIGGTYRYYADDNYGYEVGSTRAPEGWAVRLDQQGNEVWNRVFGHNAIPDCHDYLYNAAALLDGSFIATGSTHIADSFYYQGALTPYIRQAAWVVRLNSDGCINPGCPGTLGTGKETLDNNRFSLYPNPGNGQIKLSCTTPLKTETQLIILDQLGRIIQQQNIPKGIQEYNIDLQRPAAGLYYIRLQSGHESISFKYVLTGE